MARVIKAGVVFEAQMEGFGKVTGEFTKVGKSADKMQEKVKKSSLSFVDLAQSVTGISSAVGLLSGAVGAVSNAFTAALDGALGFEKAMLEVSTLVDTSVISMSDLSREVRALAVQFGSNATEQAKGLYQAISAGAVNASEAVKLMSAANKLSVGGVTDVFTAVDGLTTVLNAFALNLGNDALPVADLFFQTIKSGKTTATELASGIGQVAAAASTSGVSMNEMFAVIAAGSKVLGNGRRTIVSLTGAIGNIVVPSQQAIEEARRLGIAFSADALKGRGLVGILDQMTQSTNFTSESVGRLFGSIEAQRVVNALLADNLVSVKREMGNMANATGAADEAHAKMTSTLGFQLKQFTALREEISLSTAELVTKSDATLDALTSLNNTLKAMSTATDGLSPNMRETARSIASTGFEALRAVPLLGQLLTALKLIRDTTRGSNAEATIAAQVQVMNAKHLTALAQQNLKHENLKLHKNAEFLDAVKKLGFTQADLMKETERLRTVAVAASEDEARRKKALDDAELNRRHKLAAEKARLIEKDRIKAEREAAREAALEATETRRLKQIAQDRASDIERIRGQSRRATETNTKNADSAALAAQQKRDQAAIESLSKSRIANFLDEDKFKALDKNVQGLIEKGGQLAQVFGSVLGAALVDTIFNAKNFGSAMLGVIKQIAATLIANAVIFAFAALFTGGAVFAGATATSIIGGLFGFKHGGLVTQNGPVQQFADGGFVTGGRANRDSVPALLMPGEFVIPKAVVDRIRNQPNGRGSSGAAIQVNISQNVPSTRHQMERTVVTGIAPALRRLQHIGAV